MFLRMSVRIAFALCAALVVVPLLTAVGFAQSGPLSGQANNPLFMPLLQQPPASGAAGAHDASVEDAHHRRPDRNLPTIVLVHGAWADGTGWQEVIPLLEEKGYSVIAVQNPLISLANDVETTRRVIDAQPGPVIVVGHSYGGAVISGAAAGAPNVKALVFISAFALDANETGISLLTQFPTELGAALVPDTAGFLYIDRAKFRAIFAADVDKTAARVMAAAQKPVNGHIFIETLDATAWRTIPSWYMVATEDKALSPDMERFLAKRMNATTVEVKSSHVPFISRPKEVVMLIEQAAKATVN